jgi:hypothetical protein
MVRSTRPREHRVNLNAIDSNTEYHNESFILGLINVCTVPSQVSAGCLLFVHFGYLAFALELLKETVHQVLVNGEVFELTWPRSLLSCNHLVMASCCLVVSRFFNLGEQIS